MKEKLKYVLNHWEEILKFIVLSIVVFMGFLTIYGVAWILLELPTTTIGMLILEILSIGTEFLFFRWLSN